MYAEEPGSWHTRQQQLPLSLSFSLALSLSLSLSLSKRRHVSLAGAEAHISFFVGGEEYSEYVVNIGASLRVTEGMIINNKKNALLEYIRKEHEENVRTP